MFINVRAVGRYVPSMLSFAALGGVFWWGHVTDWRLTKPALVVSSAAAAAWCPEHHVAEAVCLLCRKDLGRAQANQEPAHHRTDGEELRFAQVASAAALAKSGIRVAAVHQDSLAPRLRIAAETAYPPTTVVRLSARSEGVVQTVLVQVGSDLAPGTLVAVLDVVAVGQAKSALQQALAQRALAHRNAQRTRITTAAGVRTTAELHEVEAQLHIAEVGIAAAEQALRALGLPLDASTLTELDAVTLSQRLRRLGLPDTVADNGSNNLVPLYTPHGGTVTAVLAAAGESIAANTLLAIIADTKTLWLSMPLPPDGVTHVAVGQAVTFNAAAATNESGTGMGTGTGTVTMIAQAVDPLTRLVPVWATIDNPQRQLRVGQFGTATITTGAAVMAANIPVEALQYDGAQAYVFVQRSDTIFRSLPVRILARDGERVAVDRLEAGDQIAVSGTGLLFAATFPERLGAGCTDH